MTVRVEIVDYQPSWPADFALLARRLRESLDPPGVAIHHIGSTSVPGLAAKDIIDVQITVPSLDEPGSRSGVEAAGFVWTNYKADHSPPGLDLAPAELEKRTAGSAPGGRPANLHMRVAGRFNQRYALLFRDYLRAQGTAAAGYAEVKRNLARLFPNDTDSYYALKDPVCDVIIAGAEAWAETTGWQLPPSDG
jgi:GrpB-like predicted nucleotidyltransferase (UPF0157 family)